MVSTRQGVKGTGTFASRSAVVGGAAIAKVGKTLRERLLELAAAELEASVADLEFTEVGVCVAGSPAATLSFAQLAAAAPDGHLDVTDVYDPPAPAFAYGAHACVVEVDPLLGGVDILRYAVVEDCGEIINHAVIEGQTHGATVQGISAALLEEVVYNDGTPTTSTMMDYLLPTATDAPSFDIGHLEFGPPHLLRSFKGVGEGGVIGGGLCVANAVADAIGAEIDKIPVTPREIVRLHREAAR
jgi:carbon-monoxide dehydrogenase large subunit